MVQSFLRAGLVTLSVTAVALGGAGALPGAAFAAPAGSGPKVTPVTVLKHVAGDKATGSGRDRVRQHLDDAMRRSQLISAADVQVWSGEAAGHAVTAVLPNGSSLRNVAVATQEGVDRAGLGVEIVDESAPAKVSVADGHSGGSGGNRVAEGCRTISFTNRYTGPDTVYDCFEKFKLSNTEYIYNRYSKATVTPASGTIRRELHELTIRFREAKGYSRVTGGPYNYGPLPSSVDCVNYEFSYGGVKIPIASCDEVTNVAGGSYYQSGSKYVGHENNQRYLDSYARYNTNGNVPVMSDYVWVAFGSCGYIPGIPCYGNNDSDQGWTDGLWYR